MNHYIYILKNSFMPGVLKIGFTTRSPNTRASELGNVTGVPGVFEIVKFFTVTNGREAESLIFSLLASYRVGDKEFFQIPVEKALFEIENFLEKNGLTHSGSDGGILDFSRHMILSLDGTYKENIPRNDLNARIGNFSKLFLELIQNKKDINFIDYYWAYSKSFGLNMEGCPIDLADLITVYDLFASGYAFYAERLIRKHGFSIHQPEMNWLMNNFLNIRSERNNFSYSNIPIYHAKSQTTHRELAWEYINDLRRYQKKNNFDWIPLDLAHEIVNFKNLANPVNFNHSRILLQFGFKPVHMNSKIKIGEGQMNPYPLPNTTAAVFNGRAYNLELITGLDYKKILCNINTPDWFYDWNKNISSHRILVVINAGKVIYATGRESMIEKGKGVISVACDF